MNVMESEAREMMESEDSELFVWEAFSFVLGMECLVLIFRASVDGLPIRKAIINKMATIIL